MPGITGVKINFDALGCNLGKLKAVFFIAGLVLPAVLLFYATAQGISFPSYTIGKIPNLTVRHGTVGNFSVTWNDNSEAVFSMTADPLPGGALSLEPLSHAGQLFTYIPDRLDNTFFTVTIVASLGDQKQSQSFVITPQPVLQPEQSVFGIHGHEPPVVTTYETQTFEWENPVAKLFNYEIRKTQRVQIIGENVTIGEGLANGLYEAYFNGNHRDIESMEIIGETVTFRSPARLKQTDVTIYARNLRFEGEGQLKTTPEEKTTVPEQFQHGVDGLKAGDIHLNISQVYYETPGIKLDLSGGIGQPGGAGQHGTDGFNVKYQSSTEGCDMKFDTARYTVPDDDRHVKIIYSECGSSSWGTKTWPTNGTDAKASGKPGEGGAAGNLFLNTDVSGIFSLAGGTSGESNYPESSSVYTGGRPGSPQYAVQVYFYWNTLRFCVSYDLKKNSKWPTKPGTDAAVTEADTIAGQAGSSVILQTPYAWLHPLMLRKVLNHAREDYLGQYMAEARTRLAEYAAILAQFKSDAGWELMENMIRFELDQIYDEMQILLQQIENNLDYFGNPAGWVPMLSFEVNYAVFEKEIDSAIQMLYLAYWIRTTEKGEAAKAEALVAVREQLAAEIKQAQADYDDAVNRIPLIKSRAEELKQDIFEAQVQLQVNEQKLIQGTFDPGWLACLRGGLKGVALACRIIPVYQPGIGTLGDGLEQISNVDASASWESILKLDDIASSFLDSGFDTAAMSQKAAKDLIDPAAIESNVLDYLGSMRSTGSGLSIGLGNVEDFLAENKAPVSGMVSELERLKSLDPEYQELVDHIKVLMLKNRAFTDELISTMQTVADLSNLINRNMLAIDAMNNQATPGLLVCDGRASAYLDDMEQRTYNRLLKYHYYFAKAYEYRLLKPYSQPLNLQGLLEKFKDIAESSANTDHTISSDQFTMCKSIYQNILSSVAETVFEDYNTNSPELAAGLPFVLTAEEVAKLNQGKTVTLNLMKAGLFFPDEENVRIVDLKVHDIQTRPVDGDYGTNPMLRLRMTHSGVSNFKTDGSIYQFRHYNTETENPIIWEARWFPTFDHLEQTRLSSASKSLLCTLLQSSNCDNLIFFSRPSAWADLHISRECPDGTCETINIEKVTLKLDFDFMPRNENLARKDLEIFVSQVSSDGKVSMNSDFMPHFALNRPDFNGRKDTRGRALRIYEYSSETVEITAQYSYGTWRFNKWTDKYGGDLPGASLSDHQISLLPQKDLVVCAQYIPASLFDCQADFDGDGDVDGEDLAKAHKHGIDYSKLASEFGRVDCK